MTDGPVGAELGHLQEQWVLLTTESQLFGFCYFVIYFLCFETRCHRVALARLEPTV